MRPWRRCRCRGRCPVSLLTGSGGEGQRARQRDRTDGFVVRSRGPEGAPRHRGIGTALRCQFNVSGDFERSLDHGRDVWCWSGRRSIYPSPLPSSPVRPSHTALQLLASAACSVIGEEKMRPVRSLLEQVVGWDWPGQLSWLPYQVWGWNVFHLNGCIV